MDDYVIREHEPDTELQPGEAELLPLAGLLPGNDVMFLIAAQPEQPGRHIDKQIQYIRIIAVILSISILILSVLIAR